MTRIWLEGFGLGLSTGPYCFTACAPLLVPYLFAEGRLRWRGNLLLLAEFMGGRLAAYLLAGAAAGLVGSRVSGHLPPGLLNGAILVSGLLMLAVAAFKTAPRLSACATAARSSWARRIPFVLGFIIGINLCPPFVAGLTRVLQLGGPGLGAGYFASFFIGTSLYLLPVLVAVPLTSHKRTQFIGSLACGLTGLWFTILGAAGLFGG